MNIEALSNMTAKELGSAANKNMQEELLMATPFLPESATWTQRKWHVINESYEAVLCDDCDKHAKWSGRGYSKYCGGDVCNTPSEPISDIIDKEVSEKITLPYFEQIVAYMRRLIGDENIVIDENKVGYKQGNYRGISAKPTLGYLHVSEYDWVKKNSLSMSFINREYGAHKGHVHPNSIKVVNVPVGLYRSFFNKYSFDDSTVGKTCIGLYSGTELIAAVLFDYENEAQGKWRIINKAIKVDRHVDAAITRITEYFKATFFPKEISLILNPYKDNVQAWENRGFMQHEDRYIWKSK